MKYGMNLLLWTAHVTEEHYPLLANLKKAGYDGVELPLFQGDAAHYQKVKKELDNLGLKRTAVTVCTAAANPCSGDAKVRQAGLDHLKWALDMVAAVGGEVLCGPLHSALGVFSGAGPTADERKHSADVLRQAAEHARTLNVQVALEYLNRFECYLLTTAADTAAFVRGVNHPSLRMMYDTFHANIEEKDLGKAVAACADLLTLVHISENDRGTPGSGHVHWDETFRALKQAKYDNWFVIEAFGRALPDLAAATKIWRDLFPNPEEVYADGLRFMKGKWEATRA
jgi:D-psicose/D-tagatose/L-ribulose 3-epimerase